MNRILRALLRGLLVIVVLAGGVAALLFLVKTKPAPQRQETEQRGMLVEVMTVGSPREELRVRAQGTMMAARKVVVMPEVGGRVVWQSKELVPGGRFKQGQPLLRIDASDYSLQARQQEASVDRAQLELKLEQGRKKIAKQEWEIIGEDENASAEDRELALRKPQLKAAEAALESARSAQAQAKLALGRTGLTAPFNAFVQSENVDVGQLVSPASQLAVLVGTDAFWVQLSIPVEQLPWIDVPGLNAKKGEGALATVWQEVGGQRVERAGQVVRLLGDLDPVGRMARLLVEIEDPLRLKRDGTGKAAKPSKDAPKDGSPPSAVDLPFLIGAYVTVDVQAHELQKVVEIPRVALRDGDSVYVYGANDRLVVRKVNIVWRSEKTVLVSAGVKPGEFIIVSRLPGAVPGQLLRKAATSDPKALGKR